jgi:hypothetical protein
MRGIAFLLIGATLTACAAAPQPGRSAKAENRFQQLLAGKVAGPAVSCLPTFRANDMVVIDDQTIAFRDGSRRVWVANLSHSCSNLGSGHYALVTKRYGGTGLCRGDIGQVADLSTGMTVGSCVFGDFTPYEGTRG